MTIITTEYKLFNDCSEQTQLKAIEKNMYINVDHSEWDQYLIENFTDILEILGYEDIEINYSGFWSQGDGASFTCSGFTYKKGSIAKIKKEYPSWDDLHEWLEFFTLVNKENFYQLYFDITRDSSNYSHYNTVSINNLYRSTLSNNEIDVYDNEHERVNELNRDFMKLIYRSLDQEYTDQTSSDSIKESLICNEYEFNSDGVMI
jgi:hypothetical protein